MGRKVSVMFFAFITPLSLSLAYGESLFPCYFIFGDSLFDNGNNNDLVTTAKANFPPYGIDFDGGPTGRFTNGRNIADFIAELLGFESYIPPFATASGEDILKGVNYGSGAAGIRDESGQHLGGRLCLSEQLKNHNVTISRMADLLGNEDSAQEYLSQCLYTVGMGSNDYINNYFMPLYYNSSTLYTPDQYATALVQQYSHQIKTLHNYGAKKVGIFGLGDIGCLPFELHMYGTNGSSCVGMIDNAVQLFNDKLYVLVGELNTNISDAQFIFINQTSTGNSSSFGFTELSTPCCKVSEYAAKGQCAPKEAPCSNRTEYVYWDAFHPTENANALLAALAYAYLAPFYASPVDIWGSRQGDEFVTSI